MNSFLEKIIKIGVSNPKKIFLIDSFGALVSAFLLGFVCLWIYNFIGLPKSTLYFLASIPIFFIFYNFCCYFLIKNRLYFFINGIAIMNLIYSFISFICAIFHYKTITFLGWVYIFMEIIIICFLALFELKISNKLKKDCSS